MILNLHFMRQMKINETQLCKSSTETFFALFSSNSSNTLLGRIQFTFQAEGLFKEQSKLASHGFLLNLSIHELRKLHFWLRKYL